MAELLTRVELEAIGKGYDPIPERSYSINADCYRDPRFLAIERDFTFTIVDARRKGR